LGDGLQIVYFLFEPSGMRLRAVRATNYLALLLQAQHDLAEFRPLLQRALPICERVFGHAHTDTMKIRDAVAALESSERPSDRG
jgi:hypothetical protein